jgi:predicted RNA-binding Zn-ribbon protein involved in translation (DUF1610 family)
MTNETQPKQPTPRVKLQCQECGRRFTVRATAQDPKCPRCGSVDWEVVD